MLTLCLDRYGPTAGIKELRHAVANLYNETYRQGKDSKYTHENVCIVPGGRAGLIRIAAIIGVSGRIGMAVPVLSLTILLFSRTSTLLIKFQVSCLWYARSSDYGELLTPA